MSITKEDLQDAIKEAINGDNHIEAEKHRTHHDYVELLIAKDKRKQELREYAKKTSLTWLIFGTLSAVASGLFYWFVDLLKKAS
jgi:predicted house-cleaning noncanonical NTP pyrophosphatase (MazG superfamily)